MRKFIVIVCIGYLFSSCGFIFYSYRAILITEFSILNNSVDTSLRYQIGKVIYGLSVKQKFYQSYASSTYDSLYFYGPDYHDFHFKIREIDKTTKVYLDYFGYNGFRTRPPNKKFIQSISDTLRIKFGASQIVFKDINNEIRR